MNEVIQCLTSRKSCNNYKPEHVSREEIDQILAAGLNAPSGGNLQTALFIVIQDEETLDKVRAINTEISKEMIAEYFPDMEIPDPFDPFYGAQDVVAVVVRQSPCMVYDGSLAMGNLMNAAWSIGVDSRWISRAKETFETEKGQELLKEWGIEESVEGIGFCLLGHAALEKEKTEILPNRVIYV